MWGEHKHSTYNTNNKETTISWNSYVVENLKDCNPKNMRFKKRQNESMVL